MTTSFILLVAAMAIVTYIPRFLPMAWLSRLSLPSTLEHWLSYIPLGILAALLGQALFIDSQNKINSELIRPELLALIPSLWVGWKTKNLFLPVFVGILSVAILRWLI